MAVEPKLTPGNGFFLKPNGSWGVTRIPPEVLKEAKFSGFLTILGYKSSVFEMPDGQQWGQKSIEKPEDITVASINLLKIAARIATRYY
jgi:hypothetical protein